ncbi:hypothetical protein ILUMI_25933 [Ignelater luminosus]|uniref:Uncharacterized protein n=1 Tax=Ignelater luminosus TaxID=2038154 RepID=A0A8K0C4W3_IGNLU|nr:hypothetical protein ILUMI_25933 [Ignelater luminosus]
MVGFKENILSAFILLYCGFPRCSCIFEEDYCWRDYDGVIPSDAFKAGLDKNQRPIYIGQVLYQNKLVPGSIYENKNEIHFEFGKAYTETKNIKVRTKN